MKRKSMAFMLAVVLIIGVFSGCSGGVDLDMLSTESSEEWVSNVGGNDSSETTSKGTAGSSGESVDVEVPDRYTPFENDTTDYDTSGQVKDLGGRTIYVSTGLVQSDSSLTGAEGLRIAQLKKDIESKYNCKIVTKKATVDEVIASIVSGSPIIDIWAVRYDSDFMNAYNAGMIQPLEDLKCIDLGDTTKFSNFSEKYKIGGKHYAFYPQLYGYMQISVHSVLYANKALLKSNGIDINDIYDMQDAGTWTWDAFADIAKKVSNSSTGVYAIQDDADGYLYRSLMASNNTDYVVLQNNKLKFNASSEAAKKVMNYYSQLMTDGVMNPDIAKSQQAGITNYNNGKSVFLAGWPSYHSSKWTIMNDEVMNNTAILYIPKPTKADDYVSFIGDTCPIAIPVYSARDGKSADLLARETATIINELFAPVYTQSEYQKLFANECKQAAGSDERALKTLKNLYSKSVISFNQMVEEVNTNDGKGWIEQINGIAKNPTSYQTVIDTYSNTYNSLLDKVDY